MNEVQWIMEQVLALQSQLTFVLFLLPQRDEFLVPVTTPPYIQDLAWIFLSQLHLYSIIAANLCPEKTLSSVLAILSLGTQPTCHPAPSPPAAL